MKMPGLSAIRFADSSNGMGDVPGVPLVPRSTPGYELPLLRS